MSEVLNDSVRDALTPYFAPDTLNTIVSDVVEVIQENLTPSPLNKSRNLLSLSSDPSDVYFIDIWKGFFAVIGVIGGAVSVAGTSGATTIAAGAAFIGALSALRGLKTVLPSAAGVICYLLSRIDNKQLSKTDLEKSFAEFLAKHEITGVTVADFGSALTDLRNLGCVDVNNGIVILKQTLVTR
jgi:hypothetical protein